MMSGKNNDATHLKLCERPTKITVNLGTLRENLDAIKKLVQGRKVLACVKADAYGHGLVPVARTLDAAGIDYLGVAFVEEGKVLRAAGITAPILVFGGLLAGQITDMLVHNLDVTASSLDKLRAIDAAAARCGQKANVHLKIDTGMERIGTHYYSARTFLETAFAAKHCNIVGVYSHFATADSLDRSFAELQLERFIDCIDLFNAAGMEMPLRHIANSGALLQIPESYLDMVRPGLCLYGVAPERHLADQLPTKAILRLESRVVYFKVVKAGASVSYGRLWQAQQDTRVVTLPVGYGDGFLRANSNVGSVLINGKRYPIVGAVCMDQMMVDIGSGEAYNGDLVTLVGEQEGERITVEDIAERTNTIPYEVLTNFNHRIPRRYES